MDGNSIFIENLLGGDIVDVDEVRVVLSDSHKKKPLQICSTPGCENFAAYRTRSKPAYCLDCIDRIMSAGGLKREGDFVGPNEWLLTTCRSCGVQAHYRFNYVLEKNKIGEKTCRACFWKKWYRDSWNRFGAGQGAGSPLSDEEASAFAHEHGFELLQLLHGDVPGEEL